MGHVLCCVRMVAAVVEKTKNNKLFMLRETLQEQRWLRGHSRQSFRKRAEC